MFCPKCGTENPDNGRFCRSCRAEISNVLAAIDVNLATVRSDNNLKREDSNDLYIKGIRNVILGMGLLVASIFVKIMPGDTLLWLYLMIPAIVLVASGIPKILKAEAVKKELKATKSGGDFPIFVNNNEVTALPADKTEYVSPDSKFKTSDLANDLVRIPSVTEDTTKHLKK